MLNIYDAIKEHRLLDYIYEDDQIKRLNDWLLIELLKITLEAVEDNCKDELNDLIMESIKERYAWMLKKRLEKLFGNDK